VNQQREQELLKALNDIQCGMTSISSLHEVLANHVSSQAPVLDSLEADCGTVGARTRHTVEELAATSKQASKYWPWNSAAIGASIGAVLGLTLGPPGAIAG